MRSGDTRDSNRRAVAAVNTTEVMSMRKSWIVVMLALGLLIGYALLPGRSAAAQEEFQPFMLGQTVRLTVEPAPLKAAAPATVVPPPPGSRAPLPAVPPGTAPPGSQQIQPPSGSTAPAAQPAVRPPTGSTGG